MPPVKQLFKAANNNNKRKKESNIYDIISKFDRLYDSYTLILSMVNHQIICINQVWFGVRRFNFKFLYIKIKNKKPTYHQPSRKNGQVKEELVSPSLL